MNKETLIREFNALKIADMEKVTDLNELKGDFINLQFHLPSGQAVKIWDNDKMYLGNQIEKTGSTRCYGLVTDGTYLLVCEYGDNGEDAEIIILKKIVN